MDAREKCFGSPSLFIANSTRLGEQSCLQVTKIAFKRLLQLSNVKKLFLFIYINTALLSLTSLVGLRISGGIYSAMPSQMSPYTQV